MQKMIRHLMLSIIPLALSLPTTIFAKPSLSAKALQAENALAHLGTLAQQAMQDYQVPSLAIGVIVDGHIVFAEAYGQRDIEKGLPATPDTLYGIGSCTKAFTSFLVGTFVDEGTLSWDDPVVDFLTQFRLWDSYATHHVTFRDLLSHRSGLPRHEWLWYNSHYSREEIVSRLRYLEPVCSLRERYNYNNLMYLVAGHALETITHKSWEELVTTRILAPLHMLRTNFSVDVMQKDPDYATPYLGDGDTVKRMNLRDISVIGPGGAINSSVHELMHWMQLQLGLGTYRHTTLLSKATLQEIFAPQVVSDSPEMQEILIDTYGLGWHINSYRGRYNLYHDGISDGFTALVSLLPHENCGIVILCNKNLSTLPHFFSFHIFDRLLNLPTIDWLQEGLLQVKKEADSSFEEEMAETIARKRGTHPSHSLNEYIGDYTHPGYGTITLKEVNGQLQATFNSFTYILEHWHYDTFVVAQEKEDKLISNAGMKLTFRLSLQGDVEELLIPFEPSVSDIIFKKKPQDALARLQQFVGSYEIYHYTIEIALRNQMLCALIPGQPVYELIPIGDNEFTVKSLKGYTVRFLNHGMDLAQEVLLIQPYGTYSAKRKQS